MFERPHFNLDNVVQLYFLILAMINSPVGNAYFPWFALTVIIRHPNMQLSLSN